MDARAMTEGPFGSDDEAGTESDHTTRTSKMVSGRFGVLRHTARKEAQRFSRFGKAMARFYCYLTTNRPNQSIQPTASGSYAKSFRLYERFP